jgi:hypothetical protein
MLALDRIWIVPLMFQNTKGALASLWGHAKVTGQRGGHARGPLAAGAGRAYLCALPDPYAEFRLCRRAADGAPSHGLK